jgi:hypothetical protein
MTFVPLVRTEATTESIESAALYAMMSARAESTSLKEVRFSFFVVVTAEPYSLRVTVTWLGLPSAIDETSDSSARVDVCLCLGQSRLRILLMILALLAVLA